MGRNKWGQIEINGDTSIRPYSFRPHRFAPPKLFVSSPKYSFRPHLFRPWLLFLSSLFISTHKNIRFVPKRFVSSPKWIVSSPNYLFRPKNIRYDPQKCSFRPKKVRFVPNLNRFVPKIVVSSPFQKNDYFVPETNKMRDVVYKKWLYIIICIFLMFPTRLYIMRALRPKL